MKASAFVLCLLVVGMLTACGGKDKWAAAAAAAKEDKKHNHDHSASGAPHGGHIVELGNEEYHAEWLHDNKTGLITVFLIDSEMKRDVRSESSHILITTQVKDKKPREYKLPAVNKRGNPPLSNKYELTDKVLLEAMKFAGHAVNVKLQVTIKGKSYVAAVKH